MDNGEACHTRDFEVLLSRTLYYVYYRVHSLLIYRNLPRLSVAAAPTAGHHVPVRSDLWPSMNDARRARPASHGVATGDDGGA